MRATGNPTLFPGLETPPRGAQFHVRARGRHTTASAVRVVRHPSRSTPSPPWVVLSVATCRYELQRRRPTPFRSGASKGWARSPTPSSPHYRGPRARQSYAVAFPRVVHRCKARVQDEPPGLLDASKSGQCSTCEVARNLSVSGLYRRRLLDAGGSSPTTSIGSFWSARHCGQR